MRRSLGCAVAILLVAGVGLGAWSEEAATVLDIVPGVAQAGAGGTGIAGVCGSESLYYNPAGLAALSGISFSSLYASHFGVASLTSFSLALRGIAVGAELYNSGSIQGYDSEGNPTEDLAYSSTSYMLGFGVDPSMFSFWPRLPFTFSVGGVLKGVSSRLAEHSGNGFGFDLGLRATLPQLSIGAVAITEMAAGVTLANLFGSMVYGRTQESLPIDIGVGATATIADVVTVATDVHLEGRVGFGVTYRPVPVLALRLGVLSEGGLSVTAGAGLDIQGFLIDYAFLSHAVGPTHRIGLTLDFSALDIGALGSALRRILP